MSLASSAPLCVPRGYDPNFRIDVCLSQPLHGPGVLAEFFLADFFTRLTHLDILIRKHMLISRAQKNVKKKDRLSLGSYLSEAQELTAQLTEMVSELGLQSSDPLKDFITEMDLADIMPNALAYVENECSQPVRLHTSRIDYYFTEVNLLHQLQSMSGMIARDAAMGGNHKYVAHQVVILYQLLKQFGDHLSEFRTSIESNFDALKGVGATDSDGVVRLPEKLAAWLTNLASRLEPIALNLTDHCDRLPHFQHMYQLFDSDGYFPGSFAGAS